MKDIYEVLRQKETELERVQNEMQALRIVAPLLEDVLTEVHAAQPFGKTDFAMEANPVAAVPSTKPARRAWP
jgi:hypothetical protein